MTPAIRAFLDDLHNLIDRAEWPLLDRDAVTMTSGRDAVSVVLPHGEDSRRSVNLEIQDRVVVVAYGPEHQHFTDRGEALRFIEMLGDGRVRLVVKRLLVWNSMRSYRDDLSLPFARTSEPWLNLRPRTETLQFGFR